MGAAPKRVLFACAAAEVAEKMVSLLSEKKCQTVVVSSGTDVISRIVEVDPEVIVMDVIMPGMPSKDIVKRLRKNPFLKKKKVLIFSHVDKESLATSEAHKLTLEVEGSKTNCMEFGADEYLGGFSDEGFSAVLDKALKK